MLNGQNVLCIYQDGNIDSFLGAWVVWKTAPNASFIHRVEQTLPSDLEGRDVYVIGATIPLRNLVPMANFCNSLTIFGFEKTFGDEIKDLGHDLPGNINLVYNPIRSLATIAWHFFGMGAVTPPLLTYVEDRVQWRFQYPETRPVTAALMGYQHNFDAWDPLIRSGDIQMLVEEGKVVLKRLTRDVEYALRIGRRRINIGGYDIPAANTSPLIASDACIQMAKGEPFAACYWDTNDGREYDLVATSNGIDVSELVRAYGGHGTRHEARFRVPKGHPLAAA